MSECFKSFKSFFYVKLYVHSLINELKEYSHFKIMNPFTALKNLSHFTSLHFTSLFFTYPTNPSLHFALLFISTSRKLTLWITYVQLTSLSVDKKNRLDVTFCILYFSSNSCSTCFGQPCVHHQELTTA
jgi:hypothetical protein